MLLVLNLSLQGSALSGGHYLVLGSVGSTGCHDVSSLDSVYTYYYYGLWNTVLCTVILAADLYAC